MLSTQNKRGQEVERYLKYCQYVWKTSWQTPLVGGGTFGGELPVHTSAMSANCCTLVNQLYHLQNLLI